MLETVYRTEARFLQHLQAQKANIEQFKNEVGADAAMIQQTKDDADVMEFLMETCNLADNFKKTSFGIKKQFFSIKTSPPIGDFSAAPSTTPPAVMLAGAEKRARERDQYFLRSPNLTEAAKIALDLIGEESDPIAPDEIKPQITAHPAQYNYEFALVVSDRGEADMYDVLYQRADTPKWQIAKSGTGKSVNVTLEPTEAGKPEQILVCVQLKKKDKNYGTPSDPVYVTINP